MSQMEVLRNFRGLTTIPSTHGEEGSSQLRIYGHTYLRPDRDVTSEIIQYYRTVYGDWGSAGIADFLRAALLAQMSEPRKVEFPGLDWFLQNFDRLVKEYPDQWLAIVNNRVVANASNPRELRDLVKALGVSRPFVAHASRQAWGRME